MPQRLRKRSLGQMLYGNHCRNAEQVGFGKLRSRSRRAVNEQHSTGVLHLIVQIPLPL